MFILNENRNTKTRNETGGKNSMITQEQYEIFCEVNSDQDNIPPREEISIDLFIDSTGEN